MSKQFWLAAAAAATLTGQTPQIHEEKRIHVIATPSGAAGAGGVAWLSAESSFEATLVKGVPFTGEFVTETTQVLADGNRIRSSNTTAFARDGEGRTRREMTLGAIGPFAAGAPKKTIFIHDPVSKIDYILDPDAKTARKINVGAMTAKALSGEGGQTMVFNRRVDGPKEERVVITDTGAGPVQAERIPLPPGLVLQGEAGAVVRQRIMVSSHPTGEGPAAASAANFKNEPLGKRIIEGVEAEGTRTTVTIPAGQIGNERALDTVSERWYSNELKTVVMTTRRDPRTGENTYKLTNLRRGEPARQMFEVPADYKIIDEPAAGNVIRMRVEKKQE